MAKLKIFTLILMLLPLASCRNLDDFWTQHDGLTDISEECSTAQTNLSTAYTNFQSADNTNYTEKCNAYKEALQAIITDCGDASGSFQNQLDALGDCTNADAQDCADAQQAKVLAKNAFDALSPTDDGYAAACNFYKLALEAEIEACGDTSGALQAIVDGLNCN